jgi:methionyl-tRNA formyltransferase
MNDKKIAVLTSRESWFVPFAKKFVAQLQKKHFSARLFYAYSEIPDTYSIVFILSYFDIIPARSLKKHRYNVVVHESDLPKGRGWAPLSWQILEGRNKIPIVLFEATKIPDQGNVYLKDLIVFKGDELYDEIRKKQAKKTNDLCLRFLSEMKNNRLRSRSQKGKPSYYCKRTPADSELMFNKTIAEQFNLLQIVDNVHFPAFFYHKGHKYIIQIKKEEK